MIDNQNKKFYLFNPTHFRNWHDIDESPDKVLSSFFLRAISENVILTLFQNEMVRLFFFRLVYTFRGLYYYMI